MNLFCCLLLTACCLLTAGCGMQGEPLPPLLNLPQPAEISAVQRGNRILIDWAAPSLTTEGQSVRPEKLGPVEVYRAVLPGLRQGVSRQEFEAAAQRIAQLPAGEAHYVAELQAGGPPHTAAFAVRLLNDRGHSAGFSNIAAVPVLAAPPSPAALRFNPTEKALVLEWPAVTGAAAYHVYRSEQASPGTPPSPFQRVATVQAPNYADENFEWGREYRYLVRSVAAQESFQAESADSPVAAIRPEDIFPPRVPAGLVAVVSAPESPAVVELSWEPNSEPDLAGYNVFRGDAGGAQRRLNTELLVSPAFRDTTVKPGISYSYSVNAVDQKGNQSARSEAVTVKP